mmetsp:Transcript_39446/g.85230  ORF Transcript_39446/g.85230 Transcript_39446/m.85230 type:complete len:132 (+) Transcript_39446:24-419(+)
MSFREMWPSAPLLLTNRFTNFFTNMGKKKADPGHDPIPGKGLESYIEALRKQLSDKQRVIRAFDVGGSGVKTGLLTASALQDFLHWGGQAPGLRRCTCPIGVDRKASVSRNGPWGGWLCYLVEGSSSPTEA